MRINLLENVNEYKPAGHYDMRCYRLQGKGDEGECVDFTLGLSYFLPGAYTDYNAAGVELTYCVTEGELTLRTEEGVRKMHKYDTVHFNIGDLRSMTNESKEPAAMLVIAGNPKQ